MSTGGIKINTNRGADMNAHSVSALRLNEMAMGRLIEGDVVKTSAITVSQCRYLPKGDFSLSHSNAVRWGELVEFADAIQARNQFPKYEEIVAWNEVQP